jgi:hypothetical protein
LSHYDKHFRVYQWSPILGRPNGFESIPSDLNARLKEMENLNRHEFHSGWRKAMVRWLVCQNRITLSNNPTSVTHFLVRTWSHQLLRITEGGSSSVLVELLVSR